MLRVSGFAVVGWAEFINVSDCEERGFGVRMLILPFLLFLLSGAANWIQRPSIYSVSLV